MNKPLKFSIWLSIVIAAVFVVAWLWIRESSEPGPYDLEPVSIVRNGNRIGLTPSEVEGWQTYRNEKYGFEFKYPPYFDTRLNENEIELTLQSRLTPDWLRVVIDPMSLDGFRYTNPPAGVDIVFNSELRSWEGNGVEDSPKRKETSGGLVYYYAGLADIMAVVYTAIMENPLRNFVITLKLSIGVCFEEDFECNPAQSSEKTFDQILSTFKFLK